MFLDALGKRVKGRKSKTAGLTRRIGCGKNPIVLRHRQARREQLDILKSHPPGRIRVRAQEAEFDGGIGRRRETIRFGNPDCHAGCRLQRNIDRNRASSRRNGAAHTPIQQGQRIGGIQCQATRRHSGKGKSPVRSGGHDATRLGNKLVFQHQYNR